MPQITLFLAIVQFALRLLHLHVCSAMRLRAEVIFLRHQLALYAARGVRPRRARDLDRILLALSSSLFAWRETLLVVKPATLIRWQRSTARLFWRWKSRPLGRPPLPPNLRDLIRRMHSDNPLWGEERIAAELAVKLGLRVSARTVRKYLPSRPPCRRRGRGDQAWSTFIRNHARAVVACDFVVSMSIRFQILYTLVVMEIGSRRILHTGATCHPTAAWTMQQLRQAIPAEGSYRDLLHDRDSIFSADLDAAMERLGLRMLKSPPRSPKANAFCERVIGTLRRECLDHVIVLSESHLRRIVAEWAEHYNRGRPHSALDRSVPEATDHVPAPLEVTRHGLPSDVRIIARPVLGGLHHEYARAA